jgi:hypothetical protein
MCRKSLTTGDYTPRLDAGSRSSGGPRGYAPSCAETLSQTLILSIKPPNPPCIPRGNTNMTVSRIRPEAVRPMKLVERRKGEGEAVPLNAASLCLRPDGKSRRSPKNTQTQ